MGWLKAGTQTAQYNYYGMCPYTDADILDAPFTVDNLQSGITYDIAIVDPQAIGCGVDDPTKLSCRHAFYTVQGDQSGARLTLTIP